jgi:excisionase family DNA binding protein
VTPADLAPLDPVTSVALARFIASPIGQRLVAVARTLGDDNPADESSARLDHGLVPPVSPVPPPGAVLATVDQVAVALQIPVKSVYALIARGELRGVRRFGRTVRIDLAEAMKGTEGPP